MAHAKRILLVEDEYLIAHDLAHELRAMGVVVLGPFPTVGEALEQITSGGAFDGAMLDINLRGEPVYPVADALIERGVPIVFATGYDEDVIPDRYADIPRCGKPVTPGALKRAIGGAFAA